MENAFAWLQAIMERLGEFVPRFPIVPPTHRAIKWVGGDRVVLLEPGQHVYWPVRTVFKMIPTARQAMDLRPQKLTTKDDRTILVGALIAYEIDDAEKAFQVWNADNTIDDVALRAVTKVILGLDWQELKEMARKGTLDTQLRNAAQRVLTDYGVKVLEMSLTDLATTRVISLAQSTNVI